MALISFDPTQWSYKVGMTGIEIPILSKERESRESKNFPKHSTGI